MLRFDNVVLNEYYYYYYYFFEHGCLQQFVLLHSVCMDSAC